MKELTLISSKLQKAFTVDRQGFVYIVNKDDILKKHLSKYFIKRDNGKFIVKQSKGGKYEEVATKRNKLSALYEIKSLYEKDNQNEQISN